MRLTRLTSLVPASLVPALFVPALAALTLASPALAMGQEPALADRYIIDVSVMRGGTEIVSGRTTIREGGQAEILLTGADGQYMLTADLQPEQGDGDESRLMLEAYLNHDGADMASPRLAVTRGARALMQMGSRTSDAAQLHDGVEISLTPLP